MIRVLVGVGRSISIAAVDNNPWILGVFSEVGFKSFGSANSLKYKKLDPLVVKERENNTNINEVIQEMNDYVTYNSLGGWL